MLLENVGRKSWDGLVIGDVEGCGVYIALRAVLLDELLEVLLSASADNDAGTGLDELFPTSAQ
jgi:hypothetical protein